MMDVDNENLGDLMQQAEQLTAHMDSGGELPRMERNLYQIMEAGQRLWSRTAQVSSRDAAQIKAGILLGSKGFDLQKITGRLETLSAAKMFEPVEPLREMDIQGFLRNERENAILAVIEESRKNTFDQAELHHWDSLMNEWEQEKQRILNTLMSSGQEIDLPQEHETVGSDAILMHGRSAMDSVEMAYARQVYIYNDDGIQGGIKPSLVHMFAEVAKKVDDKNVQELWRMVEFMVEVPVIMSSDVIKSRTAKDMQIALVDQGRKYLQESYLKYITTTVQANLQQAKLGGIPGTYHVVQSFLNIKLSSSTPGLEDGLVDGQPVWAMIYYCIRCGDLQAALQVSQDASHHLAEFISYLQEYISNDGRRLSPNSETKVRLLYRRSIRNSTDPYKRAVYCLIGCCDANDDHSEIADKVDDYLWLKLSQLNFDGDNDQSQDRLTLQQLQTMMLEEYGESHFNGYQRPFLYFEVLFLTGQFEAAIEFLSRIDRLRCHSVHVALVLFELKLLALPINIQSQLLSTDPVDKTPMKRLNFARLIMLYTHKFEATDPREALQYYYFLRELKGSKGENLFMACISELALETREFEMLLGRLESDGCRKPGCIDKFGGDSQKIIELVARDTENKGLFEDAVKLYDLAKNNDKVLSIMNKLLSQVASQAPSPQSTRDRLQALALGIANRYKVQGHNAGRENTGTFYLLLDLITFFDHCHANELQEALTVIQQLKLIPLQIEEVEQQVASFRLYSDEICRNLPDVLLAAMNILFQQYKTIRNTGTRSLLIERNFKNADDGGQEKYIEHLRRQARAIITFAGMIPYRMPGDTNARLVQMEVLMN